MIPLNFSPHCFLIFLDCLVFRSLKAFGGFPVTSQSFNTLYCDCKASLKSLCFVVNQFLIWGVQCCSAFNTYSGMWRFLQPGVGTSWRWRRRFPGNAAYSSNVANVIVESLGFYVLFSYFFLTAYHALQIHSRRGNFARAFQHEESDLLRCTDPELSRKWSWLVHKRKRVHSHGESYIHIHRYHSLPQSGFVHIVSLESLTKWCHNSWFVWSLRQVESSSPTLSDTERIMNKIEQTSKAKPKEHVRGLRWPLWAFLSHPGLKRPWQTQPCSIDINLMYFRLQAFGARYGCICG